MNRRLITISQRRGVAAVLAMLFLVLFSVLAVGFYSAVTMGAQLSRNDTRVVSAQLAAETGLQFLRYQLAQLAVPPGTTTSTMASEVYADLKSQLETTTNLGSRTVTMTGNTIYIPAISVNSGAAFSAQVVWTDPTLQVTVTGTSGTGASTISRKVRNNFRLTSRRSSVFNYGVASRGAVQIKNSVSTTLRGTPDASASVLSAFAGSPSISTGKGLIEGDLAVVVNKSQVSLGSGSVGGSSISSVIISDHIAVVPPPEFPTLNTDVFKPLAVNTYASGQPYKNIRIPANTNPMFNGGDVIQGIMYIESPNKVTFRGNATINGIIVFEAKGNPLVNVLDFKGNVTPSLMPNTAEFAPIKAVSKGLAIGAPTAALGMSGSVDATLEGSVIAYQISLNGSADISLQKGSLISIGPNTTDISTDIAGKVINFNGTASDNPPTTGITFSGNFIADPMTYVELLQ